MTTTFHVSWKKGYIDHYNRFEKDAENHYNVCILFRC